MKIQNDIKNFGLFGTSAEEDRGKLSKEKSIQAKDLNLNSDPIEEKRKKARDMSMKLLKDAYSNDKAIDMDLDVRRQRARDLERSNREYEGIIDNIASERENLKEIYGVEDGSPQDQELQLLRKEKAAWQSPTVKLTEEEQQQVAAIRERGLTDYEKQMLVLDDNEREYQGKIQENEQGIVEENAIIRGMQIERLKYHDMVDAVKQSDEIMKTASDEIVGMLRQEAVDNIDEQMEELKKKAEEKKAKEEALEERIEAARADKNKDDYEDDQKDMLELTNTLNKLVSGKDRTTIKEVRKSLTQIANELALSSEDLKGMTVDKKVK